MHKTENYVYLLWWIDYDYGITSEIYINRVQIIVFNVYNKAGELGGSHRRMKSAGKSVDMMSWKMII